MVVNQSAAYGSTQAHIKPIPNKAKVPRLSLFKISPSEMWKSDMVVVPIVKGLLSGFCTAVTVTIATIVGFINTTGFLPCYCSVSS